MRSPGSRCLVLAVVLCPGLASAERLVPVREVPMPFSLEVGLPLLVEHGSLIAFGDDVETRADRAVRIDATTVTEAPALGRPHVTDIVTCGGARWVLELTMDKQQPKYSIESPGSPSVWSQVLPTDIAMRCVAGHILVGQLQDGELVTQVLSPTVEPERRVRVAPSGTAPTIQWLAATTDELYAAIASTTTGATELVSIAGGAVTHRQPLGTWLAVSLALGARSVLVGVSTPATVQSFTRGDLTPGKLVALPNAQLESLSPGPDGIVALAVLDGWIGQRGGPPMAYGDRHYAWLVRLWNPATGAIGPAEDFGEASTAKVAWLGTSLVVLTPFMTGADRNQPSRIRRFTLGR